MNFWTTILWITAAIALALAAVLIARLRFRSRVRDVTQFVSELAWGNWDARPAVTGDESLRTLVSRINQLAERAQKQLGDLDARRADLQALVDSLPDPIILSAPDRRIAVFNAPAGRLLRLSSAQAMGMRLVHVLDDPVLLETFEAAERCDVPVVAPRELQMIQNGQRRLYHAQAVRSRGGGVLVILRDVTELAGTVQMKTDFVANASHELRTPIAAIRVAIETLKDVLHDDPEQAQRCANIADEHVRRLEEMLGDLLDLSRVENPDIKPTLAPISAEHLFTPVRETLAPMISAKGVEVIFEWDMEAPQFISDRRLLHLILKNLVENSIKFTAEGGTITVRVRESAPEEIAMTVTDTGIGIPPEALDRVFERFYQVDAARSGSSSRGTGLGLAIVKHAAHALGGKVELKSAVGEGTTVTCRFVKSPTPQQSL